MVGGPGGDTFNGGPGPSDLADYSAEIANLTITIDSVANDAGQGDDVRTSTENVTGGDGNDTITGSAASERAQRRRDDPLVVGDTGNDTLNGGGGNDTLNGCDGNDELNGNDGAD